MTFDSIMCQWSGCPEKPTEYWYIRTTHGMAERSYCYAHAQDARGNDRAAFADDYMPGSDEGEA